MVKPVENGNEYDSLYISTDELYNKDYMLLRKEGDSTYCNTIDIKKNDITAQVYFYPCKKVENCKECFEKFSLTMKPNGTIMVCKKSIDNVWFKNLLDSKEVEFEFVDYIEMYNL